MPGLANSESGLGGRLTMQTNMTQSSASHLPPIFQRENSRSRTMTSVIAWIGMDSRTVEERSRRGRLHASASTLAASVEERHVKIRCLAWNGRNTCPYLDRRAWIRTNP